MFEAMTLTVGIAIDLDGDRPLSDNFFDLVPGVPHRVEHGVGDVEVIASVNAVVRAARVRTPRV